MLLSFSRRPFLGVGPPEDVVGFESPSPVAEGPSPNNGMEDSSALFPLILVNNRFRLS